MFNYAFLGVLAIVSLSVCSCAVLDPVDDAPVTDIAYSLLLVPTKTSKGPRGIENFETSVKELQKQVATLQEKLSLLESKTPETKHSQLTVTADSLAIGRWVIEVNKQDESLIIKDTKSEGEKRYAFPVGGNSDMYKAGTGGEIHANRIIFPTQWSIGEETSYLVFRDRGVPGVDRRYAMKANYYYDIGV